MLYKCNFCDPPAHRGEKSIKTVDTDKMDFIKDDKGKYYHLECFEKHLIKHKKIEDEDERNEIISRLLELTKSETLENTQKDIFLKWIMNFYDGSLPKYFLMKLQSVRSGTYEGLNESIDYETLLDIYTYMEKYLQKIAMNKKIEKVSQRMNYDLAVVIGNYGDYKKFKRKQHGFAVDKNEVDKQIKVDNKLANRSEPKVPNGNIEGKEFDITDIIDELLL